MFTAHGSSSKLNSRNGYRSLKLVYISHTSDAKFVESFGSEVSTYKSGCSKESDLVKNSYSSSPKRESVKGEDVSFKGMSDFCCVKQEVSITKRSGCAENLLVMPKSEHEVSRCPHSSQSIKSGCANHEVSITKRSDCAENLPVIPKSENEVSRCSRKTESKKSGKGSRDLLCVKQETQAEASSASDLLLHEARDVKKSSDAKTQSASLEIKHLPVIPKSENEVSRCSHETESTKSGKCSRDLLSVKQETQAEASSGSDLLLHEVHDVKKSSVAQTQSASSEIKLQGSTCLAKDENKLGFKRSRDEVASMDAYRSGYRSCDEATSMSAQRRVYTGTRSRHRQFFSRLSNSKSQRNKENNTKLPKLFHKDHDKSLIQLPRKWTTVRWTSHCDYCQRFSYISHAMIRCHDDGSIPAGVICKKIHAAKVAIAKALSSEGCISKYERRRLQKKRVRHDEVLNLCYECYGRHFRKGKGGSKYFINASRCSLRGEWFNLRKKGCNLTSEKKDDKILEHLLERACKRLKTEDTCVNLEQVCRSIIKVPEVLHVEQLNPRLSNCVRVLVRCGVCYSAPLYQHHWLRTVDPSITQEDGKDNATGQWICACMHDNGNSCASKLGHGKGYGRAVVINSGPYFRVGEKYDCFFLGSTSQDEEAILQILGAADLCKTSSSESTEEQMISALEQLNSESGGSLKSHARCCLVQSSTYEEFKTKCSLHVLCDNPRLSFSGGTSLFRVLSFEKTIPTMSDDCRQLVLDCLCAHFDLQQVRPRTNGERYRVWSLAMAAAKRFKHKRKAHVLSQAKFVLARRS